MRVLITGVGGFAGSHLTDCLLTQLPGGEIWGCDRTGVQRSHTSNRLKFLSADLRDPQATRDVIQQVRPDRIYHLAGQAFVGESWANPWDTLETNLRGQVNLLEAVRSAQLETRVLIVGSAEEYGRISPADLPLRENSPLRPDNPYSVSKVGQDLLGLQYYLSHQLHTIRVRPFNHIGPRQSRKFVAPAFASQIAAIEAGHQPPVIRVGNLEARRDFTDVRDMMRAYWLALEHGRPGEVYNIGSGRSRSVRELLEILLSFSTCPITVEADSARLRPSDVPEMVCDATKFHECTGWAPVIPFEKSLRDLLDYERSALASESDG